MTDSDKANVECRFCHWSQPEHELILGFWVANGKRFCYCENSYANGTKFDQQCPKGTIQCSQFLISKD